MLYSVYCVIGHDRSSGDRINHKSYRIQTVCGSIPVCQFSGCSDAASKTSYKSVSLKCLMREISVDRLACKFRETCFFSSLPAQPSPAQPTSASGRSPLSLAAAEQSSGGWRLDTLERTSGLWVATRDPRLRRVTLRPLSFVPDIEHHLRSVNRSFAPHLGAHPEIPDGLVSSRLVPSLVQGDRDRCALSVRNSHRSDSAQPEHYKYGRRCAAVARSEESGARN